MFPSPASWRARVSRLATLCHRVVSALETRRRFQTTVVVVLALVAALTTAALAGAAVRSRENWSGSVAVLLAARALPSGHSLIVTDVRRASVPPALAPRDALAEIPPDARLAHAIAGGTIITTSLLAIGGRIDPPPGWRVVAVADSIVAPDLSPGDVVDVIALDAVVAAGAVVIETRDGVAYAIAVTPEDAARTATSMHAGDATLVLATVP